MRLRFTTPAGIHEKETVVELVSGDEVVAVGHIEVEQMVATASLADDTVTVRAHGLKFVGTKTRKEDEA